MQGDDKQPSTCSINPEFIYGLHMERFEENLRKCDKLKDHSDALADINKISKLRKMVIFNQKRHL